MQNFFNFWSFWFSKMTLKINKNCFYPSKIKIEHFASSILSKKKATCFSKHWYSFSKLLMLSNHNWKSFNIFWNIFFESWYFLTNIFLSNCSWYSNCEIGQYGLLGKMLKEPCNLWQTWNTNDNMWCTHNSVLDTLLFFRYIHDFSSVKKPS